jgi:RNA polymerase sigma factor (sigma-70 family)
MKDQTRFILTEEQSKLAADNYDLVFWYMGKKPMPDWIDHDEYHSVLNKFFIRGIVKYDPAKAKISTYLIKILHWARIYFLRKMTEHREFFKSSIYQPDGFVIENPVSEDQDANLVALERQQFVEKLLGTINPVSAKVVRLHMDGVRFTDIAKVLKVSRQRVQQIHVESIRIMKKYAWRNKLTRESIGV